MATVLFVDDEFVYRSVELLLLARGLSGSRWRAGHRSSEAALALLNLNPPRIRAGGGPQARPDQVHYTTGNAQDDSTRPCFVPTSINTEAEHE